jgi:hypothetical protein
MADPAGHPRPIRRPRRLDLRPRHPREVARGVQTLESEPGREGTVLRRGLGAPRPGHADGPNVGLDRSRCTRSRRRRSPLDGHTPSAPQSRSGAGTSMTPAPAPLATNPTRPERVGLPRRSDFLYRWIAWWISGYLRKHFHAIRLARGTRPDVPPDLPLIVVLNHPSWWDPLIGVVLAGLSPDRSHYAPMDAQALRRYWLCNRLGF